MANAMYSPYLQFAPTFSFYGRQWGANDQAAFERALRKHGINPARFYKNHAVAAKVFDPVQQMLYGQLQPQFTALDAARQKQADYYSNLMRSLGNFTSALMPYLTPIAGQVSDMYKSGANADQSLGSGYGSLFDTQQNANAAAGNKTLSNLGLNQVVPGSNDAGVLSTLGGGLEAEILKAAGPAWAADAAQLPKSASLEAQTTMRDLMSQAQSAAGDFNSQIMQIIQGIPALQSQYQQQQQAYSLQLRKQKLAEITAAEEAAYKNWYIARTNKNDKEAQYWKRQQNILEKQRIAISQANSDRATMKAMGLAPDGSPLPGYHIDPRTGRSVPNTKGGSGGLREGETPAAVRVKAVKDLQAWIRAHSSTAAFPDKTGTKPKVRNFTYDQAFQYLYHAYVGYVKTSFKNEAAYRKMIKDILAANGITPGGK